LLINCEPFLLNALWRCKAVMLPISLQLLGREFIGNYSEGGQKIKKPCPAYFSNDYIENLILNWREN